MIQGTTPTITLRIPMGTDTLVEAEYTFSDGDKVVRTWKMNEMTISEMALSIELTEEETLAFNTGVYKTQLRVKTKEGKIMASKIIPVMVDDLLSEVSI